MILPSTTLHSWKSSFICAFCVCKFVFRNSPMKMAARLLMLFVVVSICWGHCLGKELNLAYDGLTILEQPCTTMRGGLVRFQAKTSLLQVCSDQRWIEWRQRPISTTLRASLVGHWKMDEVSGSFVDDDSGNELHGRATSAAPARGKFTRGRFFDHQGNIVVPSNARMNFGFESFSVSGWVKILNVTYPLTNFAARKGYGCYLGPKRGGWTPGWEIAHVYSSHGTNVCIRDNLNNMVRTNVLHDPGVTPTDLVGKWAQYVFVFDRLAGRVKLYINGKKQRNEVDISTIKGSVDNDKPMNFGQLYGWKTKGTLDELRLYNVALSDDDVETIHRDHRV